MIEINIGDNTRMTENDDGEFVIKDLPTGKTIATYNRDKQRLEATEFAVDMVRLTDIEGSDDGDRGLVNRDGEIYHREFDS